MNIKSPLCALAITMLASPAFAATKFYEVQNKSTKECTVVEQKPKSSGMKLISKASNATDAKADKALRSKAACETK